MQHSLASLAHTRLVLGRLARTGAGGVLSRNVSLSHIANWQHSSQLYLKMATDIQQMQDVSDTQCIGWLMTLLQADLSFDLFTQKHCQQMALEIRALILVALTSKDGLRLRLVRQQARVLPAISLACVLQDGLPAASDHLRGLGFKLSTQRLHIHMRHCCCWCSGQCFELTQSTTLAASHAASCT